MIRALLGLDKSQDVAGIGLAFRGSWVMALLLVVAAAAFAIYLYRSERRIALPRRVMMGVCQGLVLLLLILILLQPIAEIRLTKSFKRTMLVLLDTSRSMNIKDERNKPEEVAEAAVALGKIPPAEASDLDANRADTLRQEIGNVSRIDLARSALQDPAINLKGALEENFNVRFFSFDEKLQPAAGEDDLPWGGVGSEAKGGSSQVGSALEEAVGRFAGQPVAGVVVLSDFNWIDGKDPSAVARRLKARSIPTYTVPVGLPAPPDIHVRGVIAPDYVFKGDRVPLRVKLESRGFEGNSAELVLMVDGVRSTSQQIELREGNQFEELMFIPEKDTGSIELAVNITPLAGEISDTNNGAKHRVKILDEKIKVLYVEGMPRWEYRYLRWVLLRDPRIDVTFLMTQGDPALAVSSPRHIGRFPQEAKDIRKYDLIIIGDVPASYFSAGQMAELHQQVIEGGASLLMVAGPMAAPTSYRDTPIADILPVVLGSGAWDSVGGDVFPVVTPAGRQSLVTSLSLSPESSDRIWSHVRPMHRLPQLGGAKPGATVLLGLPKETEDIPDYPLVAWQPYGIGKSMFVATEDLWRMRREVGDRYHARFWGQAIQFLTLSQLLGQNKQITVETDRSTYSSGEQVRLFANVLTESFEPVLQPSYEVVLEHVDFAESSVVIELSPVPGSPGLYSGSHLASEDGAYILRTMDADTKISNQAEFLIDTEPLEDRETATLGDVARQIAELSGGSQLTLASIAGLPADLGPEAKLSNVVRIEKDLWDAPILYLLIVLFAGIEWYLRRKDNLV